MPQQSGGLLFRVPVCLSLRCFVIAKCQESVSTTCDFHLIHLLDPLSKPRSTSQRAFLSGFLFFLVQPFVRCRRHPSSIWDVARHVLLDPIVSLVHSGIFLRSSWAAHLSRASHACRMQRGSGIKQDKLGFTNPRETFRPRLERFEAQ